MKVLQIVRNRFRKSGGSNRLKSRYKLSSRLISLLVVLMILVMGVPAMVTADNASYSIPGAGTLNFDYELSNQSRRNRTLSYQATLDGTPISGGKRVVQHS